MREEAILTNLSAEIALLLKSFSNCSTLEGMLSLNSWVGFRLEPGNFLEHPVNKALAIFKNLSAEIADGKIYWKV